METMTSLIQANIMALHHLRRPMRQLAIEAELRNIDCVMECGLGPCRHSVDSGTAQHSAQDHQEESDPCPHLVRFQHEDVLPLLVRNAWTEIHGAKPARQKDSKYSAKKRCNCLSHRKRRMRSEDSVEEADGVSALPCGFL